MAAKPILQTYFQNPTYAPVDDPAPPAPTWAATPDWGEEVNQSTTTFPLNPKPSWEWTPILARTDESGSPLVGMSGTVGDQHESGQDYPFTHPFGYDWNVDVVPDAPYVRLLAPGNKIDLDNLPTDDRADLTPGILWANKNGLPTKGIMHVEFDRGLISQAYRARSRAVDDYAVHDRVVVFGRWIVDCGHPNFQSEIHPPIVLAVARIAGGVTRSTLLGHACLVSQQWGDGAMLAHLIKEILKLLPVVPGMPWTIRSTRAEAHPTILPPLKVITAMTYVVRPPVERRTAADVLMVNFRITVRTGVTVTVSLVDDSIGVSVFMVEEPYAAATPHAAFTKHDWNIGLDYLQSTLGELYSGLSAGALAALPIILAGATGFPDGYTLSVLLSQGILTDRYEHLLAPLVVGVGGTQCAAGEMPAVTPVTIDDTQPFPVCGWIDVWWAGDTMTPSQQPPLDVLVHVSDVGDLTFGDNEVTIFPAEAQAHWLQGFLIRFDPVVPGLSMEYMAHLEDTGDTAWMPEGTFIGTRGQSKRVEGFAIRLTGAAAATSHVHYMADVQGDGQTKWVSDGAFCGTRGESKELYSITVRVTQNLPQLTFALAPVMTSLGSMTFVFATATNGRVYSCQAPLGGQFMEWREIAGGGQTDAAPGVTSIDGAVFVFIKGLDGRIWLNQARPDTNPASFDPVAFASSFSGWFEVQGGGTTDSGPTAATIGNQVYVFVKWPDQRVMFNQATYGQAFGSWVEVQGNGATDKAPAATAVGNTLFVFIKKLDGLVYVNQALKGQPFGGWVALPGSRTTDMAPAAATVEQTAFCFIKGLDRHIYLIGDDLGHPFGGWGEVEGNGMTTVAVGAGAVEQSLFVFAISLAGAASANEAQYKQPFVGWSPLTTASITGP